MALINIIQTFKKSLKSFKMQCNHFVIFISNANNFLVYLEKLYLFI